MGERRFESGAGIGVQTDSQLFDSGNDFPEHRGGNQCHEALCPPVPDNFPQADGRTIKALDERIHRAVLTKSLSD